MPKTDREFEGFTRVKGAKLVSECERCGKEIPYVNTPDDTIRILCGKCQRKIRMEELRDAEFEDFIDEEQDEDD